MNFEYELIYVVLNEGYSDDVMEAARPAGATGGTVSYTSGQKLARGRDYEFDVQWGGIHRLDTAAIGGDNDERSCAFTLNGGRVTAFGGSGAASVAIGSFTPVIFSA